MFETTSVPQGWVQMINDHLDEIWVPSKFQKAVFLKEGVKKPIVVIKVLVLDLSFSVPMPISILINLEAFKIY